MTWTCLDRLYSPIVAVAGVILCGCPMDNPGFFDTEGSSEASTGVSTTTGTSGTTTTSGSAGSSSSTGSGSTTTTTTTTTTTSTTDMTTAASLPDTTSTTDPGTTTETGGSSSGDTDTTGQGGCDNPVELVMDAVEDAFFIAGSTDAGLYCNYYDQPIDWMKGKCTKLNFGTTPSLRFARIDGGITSMMAIRFPHQPIADLVMLGQQILEVRVRVTLYDALQNTESDLTLYVGKIKEEWLDGTKNGQIAGDADSNFAFRNVGVQAAWSGNDGPRGASEFAADLVIPIGYADHQEVDSESFLIDDWIEDPVNKNHGVVIAYTPNQPLVYGPGIKAVESGELGPKLVVRHCTP